MSQDQKPNQQHQSPAERARQEEQQGRLGETDQPGRRGQQASATGWARPTERQGGENVQEEDEEQERAA